MYANFRRQKDKAKVKPTLEGHLGKGALILGGYGGLATGARYAKGAKINAQALGLNKGATRVLSSMGGVTGATVGGTRGIAQGAALGAGIYGIKKLTERRGSVKGKIKRKGRDKKRRRR